MSHIYGVDMLASKTGPGLTNRIDLPITGTFTRRHSMGTDHRSAIDSITAQLIEKYQPEKIILFGSAARGDATPGSDIDLLIIKRDTPHYSADRIMELSRLIALSIGVER